MWKRCCRTLLKTARSKYSFDFTVDGVASRTWYDPNTGQTYIGSNKKSATDMLGDLAEKIERVIRESQSKSDVDEVDIRNYLCKHLQAMIDVHITMVEMVKAKMYEKMH